MVSKNLVVIDGKEFTRRQLTDLLVEDFFPYISSPNFTHMKSGYIQKFTDPEFDGIYHVDGETHVGFISANMVGEIFTVRGQYFTDPDGYKAQYEAHTELFD